MPENPTTESNFETDLIQIARSHLNRLQQRYRDNEMQAAVRNWRERILLLQPLLRTRASRNSKLETGGNEVERQSPVYGVDFRRRILTESRFFEF